MNGPSPSVNQRPLFSDAQLAAIWPSLDDNLQQQLLDLMAQYLLNVNESQRPHQHRCEDHAS